MDERAFVSVARQLLLCRDGRVVAMHVDEMAVPATCALSSHLAVELADSTPDDWCAPVVERVSGGECAWPASYVLARWDHGVQRTVDADTEPAYIVHIDRRSQ